MRLASYRHDGCDNYGIVMGDNIAELSAKLPFRTLREALADMPLLMAAAQDAEPTHVLADVELLPPVVDPPRILCVGRNFRSAMLRANLEFPAYPILFARFAASHVGHGQPIIRPIVSDQLDYEGELAVIIGKEGRYLREDNAMAHVAGYSCYNDGSVRDFQRHTSQDTPGKNFWRSGAMGPWITTADEIADPAKLTLTTWLNGEKVQQSGLDDLLFNIPQVLCYLSKISPLQPGDIIALGTPFGAGVNMDPPRWLVPGDEVRVEISGIGTLTNHVVDEIALEPVMQALRALA